MEGVRWHGVALDGVDESALSGLADQLKLYRAHDLWMGALDHVAGDGRTDSVPRANRDPNEEVNALHRLEAVDDPNVSDDSEAHGLQLVRSLRELLFQVGRQLEGRVIPLQAVEA